MDSSLPVIILCLFFAISIAIVMASVAFCIGRLYEEQKSATKNSFISLGLSIAAFSDARGLRNSTVIQRIIEKYNVVKKGESVSEAVQKLEEEIAEATGILSEEELESIKKKRATNYNNDEFDQSTKDLNLEDLV